MAASAKSDVSSSVSKMGDAQAHAGRLDAEHLATKERAADRTHVLELRRAFSM